MRAWIVPGLLGVVLALFMAFAIASIPRMSREGDARLQERENFMRTCVKTQIFAGQCEDLWRYRQP